MSSNLSNDLSLIECPDNQDFDEKIYENIDKQNGIYLCPFDYCQKGFKEKGNFITHIRVHTGDKPFVCSVYGCNKTFITKGNLKAHMTKHIGHSLYPCNFPACKKSYSQKSRYIIHLRTHNGYKPFTCSYKGCEKKFNEKGNMLAHERSHTQTKPYQCYMENCYMTFKSSIILKIHLSSHGFSNKSFCCNKCDKEYTRYSTLMTHIKIHLKEDNLKKAEGILNVKLKGRGPYRPRTMKNVIDGEFISLEDNEIKVKEEDEEEEKVVKNGINHKKDKEEELSKAETEEQRKEESKKKEDQRKEEIQNDLALQIQSFQESSKRYLIKNKLATDMLNDLVSFGYQFLFSFNSYDS